MYSYEFETSVRRGENLTQNPAPCPVGSPADLTQSGKLLDGPVRGERLDKAITYTQKGTKYTESHCFSGCEGESNLSMWIYVLLGNVLRGIGETPVQPLGISYIDDFATEENAALYVGKKTLLVRNTLISKQSLFSQHNNAPIASHYDCMTASKTAQSKNKIMTEKSYN